MILRTDYSRENYLITIFNMAMRKGYYDVLKAIAIIAVVLYHLGTCEFGYLGVDVFLVIAGYFTAKSIENQIIRGGGIFQFLLNRAFRLWPLLLLAGVVCLIYGWVMMLPDNFENTAQSVVATNFFGNNILESITTKNYWDVCNDYKPLMHTWYVGLLMQYYVLVPLFFFCIGHFAKDAKQRRIWNVILASLLCIVSLILYILPGGACAKFYYLQYRLYEFCVGSLVFYLFNKSRVEVNKSLVVKCLFSVVYIIVIVLLFVEADIISRPVRLLLTVGLTALLIYMMPRVQVSQGKIFSNHRIALIGSASYSVFVWHQVVFALTRYSFTGNLTDIAPFVSVFSITALLSILSYKYIERVKFSKSIWISSCLIALLSTSASLYIYATAGVVRDVPELDVVKGNVHRGMWAEYCDRGYKYDKNFTTAPTPKWYVIGNSFGRDLVNVIVESGVTDSVEVSYSDVRKYKDEKERFAKADIVFLSTLGVKESMIEDIKSRCSKGTKFYVIGEKNFGESNGQVYARRYAKDYHQMTVQMEEGYAEKNNRLKALYPDIYIDLVQMVRKPNGRVRVFTDDNRFISQDCRYLTKAGAQYFAGMIDWNRFLAN